MLVQGLAALAEASRVEVLVALVEPSPRAAALAVMADIMYVVVAGLRW